MRTGTQRRAAHARALAPAYTQHTTTHSARWCHMLPSFCAVADVCQATVGVAMMCLLVLASHGLGLCWMHTCTAVAALLWCRAAARCTP